MAWDKNSAVGSNTAKEENIILDGAREPSGSSTATDDQNSDVLIIRDDNSNSACLEQVINK